MKDAVKRRLKAVVALVCVISMLFQAAGILPHWGENVDEVQAEGIIPDDLDQMQEISWSDYGVTKTMIRVKMSATTDVSALAGTELGIRFYKADETGIIGDLSDSYYEKGTVVFGGDTATIEIPADKFMEDGKITGLAWAFFNGPAWDSGNTMTVRIESIEVIGKDTQKADLQAATWTQGMTGGNDWGKLANDGTAKVWSGAILYSAVRATFATPINPNEVQRKICIKASATTDSPDYQDKELEVRFFQENESGNFNTATYESGNLSFDGTTKTIEIPADNLMIDGEIGGLTLALNGGPNHETSYRIKLTLYSIQIIGAEVHDVSLKDITWANGSLDPNVHWGNTNWEDESYVWSETICYASKRISFEKSIDPDETQKKIRIKARATTDSPDYQDKELEVRFFQENESGNFNTATYESGNLSFDGTTKTIEIPADNLMTDGKISGLTLALNGGPNHETSYRIKLTLYSIQIIGAEVHDVSLKDITWANGSLDPNVHWGNTNWEDEGYVWSETICYASKRISFEKSIDPDEMQKKIRIKASATTDSPDHQNTKSDVRFYKKDTGVNANTDPYEKVQMVFDGISRIYELPADIFLSSDGKVDGIELGIFGGPKYGTGYYTTVRIESIQVLGTEVYDVDLSTVDSDATSFTDTNGSLNNHGEVAPDGTALVWNQAIQYGGKKLTFASPIDPTATVKPTSGYTAENFNNTIFNADVTIKEGGALYYGAGRSGLAFTLNGEKLKISAADYGFSKDGVAGEYAAADFGLSSFKNTKFNLKISVSDLNADQTSAKICIWINNIVVGTGEFILTQNAVGAEKLDGSMYMTDELVMTADSTMGMSIVVPTDLTDITWEDFGLSCVQAHTDEMTSNTLLTADSLNETLFSGDVIMGAGSTIRYGGGSRNFGLHINVTADDQLTFSSDTFNFATKLPEYDPERFGLDTLINQRFNLKIAVKDQTETSATFGVWINDVIAGDYFSLSNPKNSEYTMGKSISLWSGTIAPCSIIEKPELTQIALQDWCKSVANDGLLKPGEIEDRAHPTLDTLVNTCFKETFEFQEPTGTQDTDYLFCYGGMNIKGQENKDTSWYGLRLSFVGENLKITAIGSNGASFVNHLLDAETAGIDAFIGCEYTLQIDITKYKDDALVYLYFNGNLYGNGPIILSGFADQMSNTLVYHAYYQKNATDETKTAIPAYIGGRDKVLPDYYHDLDEGSYTLPDGLTEIEKRTGAGDDAWEAVTATAGSVLNAVGDYKITYNDGVSNYQMEAILYRAGCTSTGASDKRTAVDLVRVLKAVKNQKADSPYKCVVRGCDVDKSLSLDTQTDTKKNKDVSELRKYILGSREETSEMLIAGWRGPSTKQMSEETYQLLSEAGLNLMIQYEDQFGDDRVSRYPLYQQLSYASKYDMKMTIQDARLNGNAASQTEETIKEAMKDYDHFQSFYGLYMLDEPGSTEIYPKMVEAGDVSCTLEDDIQKLAAQVNGMGIPTIGNLLVYKYDYVGNRTAQYKYVQYLEKYVSNFKPTYISHTRYPFWRKSLDIKDGETVDGTVVSEIKSYFENLAMTRYVAQKNKIDFRSYVQVGDGYEIQSTLNESDKGNPSRGEFKWNANTALAFGAKGLMYFPAVQPENFVDYEDGTVGSGLIDKKGNTTVWYDYAKEVNAQVKAIDDFLMNATSTGIMATGGYAEDNAYDTVKAIKLYKYGGYTDLSLTDTINATISEEEISSWPTVTGENSEYGVLTGCFELTGKYAGKHAMYIVNFNPDQSQEVTVTFEGATTATCILNAETTVETAASVTKTLGGGEAVLVVW